MLLIGKYYIIIYLVNFIPICWLTEGFPVILSYEFPLALQAWLQLMEESAVEADPSGLKYNREAQHRYLTWRAEKVISILAFVIVSISYISFINFSDAHPSVEETQNPKNPENSGKNGTW